MNPLLLTPLKGLARNKHFRVLRESIRKVLQILKMLIVIVIAIKPRKIRKILGLVLAYRSNTVKSAQSPQVNKKKELNPHTFIPTPPPLLSNILPQITMHLLKHRAQVFQLLRLVRRQREINVLGNIVAPLLVVEVCQQLLDFFQLVAGVHAEDLVAFIASSSGLEVR
jgi:hypothetical protein